MVGTFTLSYTNRHITYITIRSFYMSSCDKNQQFHASITQTITISQPKSLEQQKKSRLVAGLLLTVVVVLHMTLALYLLNVPKTEHKKPPVVMEVVMLPKPEPIVKQAAKEPPPAPPPVKKEPIKPKPVVKPPKPIKKPVVVKKPAPAPKPQPTEIKEVIPVPKFEPVPTFIPAPPVVSAGTRCQHLQLHQIHALRLKPQKQQDMDAMTAKLSFQVLCHWFVYHRNILLALLAGILKVG